MRPTCTDCAIKHLAQASITLQESRHGYPDHIYYARGHMAEAEAELARMYPAHSDLVRTERKLLEDDEEYSPDFTALMKKIDEECEVCSLGGNPRSRPVERLPPGRTRTDEELQAIIDTYNESEMFGLKFGMIPFAKTPEDLTGQDVARMMTMKPGNPISWTKCELKYPSVQRKILSCVDEIGARVKRKKVNPFAVCRASISCPPG